MSFPQKTPHDKREFASITGAAGAPTKYTTYTPSRILHAPEPRPHKLLKFTPHCRAQNQPMPFQLSTKKPKTWAMDVNVVGSVSVVGCVRLGSVATPLALGEAR